MSETSDLWQHQKDLLVKAAPLKEFALLWDPGVGKTRGVIELLRVHYNANKKVHSTLIFAPVITLRNWINEFRTYTKILPDLLHTLEGSQVQRCNHFAAKVLEGNPNQIVITNYEALAVMPNLVKLFQQWKPHVVIADEVHKVKDSSAKRSKALYTISDSAQIRYGLTGTAILNSPMDIFGQYRFLDCGRTFGLNPFVFRGTYMYDRNAGMPKHLHFPKWMARPQAIEKIKSAIEPSCSVARKEDVLDLPPLVKKKVYVQLTAEQKRHYKNLKEDLLTQLDTDKFITATTALAKLAKLMQVGSGFLKDTVTEEITYFKKNPKADALEELLENIQPHKTIVWASFIADYNTIRNVCTKMKLPYVEAHGGISNNAKYKAVEDFEKDPTIKVFIGHPASLGIGINLISAKYMIYFSRSYMLEHDIQSEARNYRGGSEIHDSVIRYDIVAEKTVDEHCVTMLEKKAEMGQQLVSNLKSILVDF